MTDALKTGQAFSEDEARGAKKPEREKRRYKFRHKSGASKKRVKVARGRVKEIRTENASFYFAPSATKKGINKAGRPKKRRTKK